MARLAAPTQFALMADPGRIMAPPFSPRPAVYVSLPDRPHRPAIPTPRIKRLQAASGLPDTARRPSSEAVPGMVRLPAEDQDRTRRCLPVATTPPWVMGGAWVMGMVALLLVSLAGAGATFHGAASALGLARQDSHFTFDSSVPRARLSSLLLLRC